MVFLDVLIKLSFQFSIPSEKVGHSHSMFTDNITLWSHSRRSTTRNGMEKVDQIIFPF
jgi:hypothetical protein